MLNVIAMEILINDLLSNKSVFITENNYVNHFLHLYVCVCVCFKFYTNYNQIQREERYSYLEWRKWIEKRNLRGDI